jgi:antitoxin CptB
MDRETRLKRLKFRSWHRGTREADLMIGGYFDAHAMTWSDADMDWFETFLEEQDVDIMAWAMGVVPPPPQFDHPVLHAMRAMDFVPIAK